MEKLEQNLLEQNQKYQNKNEISPKPEKLKEVESELSLDFENSEKFIEQNFSRTEKEIEFEGLKYKLIEFSPKDKEVREWVLDRRFYLFGGSGNTTQSLGNLSELETNDKKYLKDVEEKYTNEWSEDCSKMHDLLENDYKEVISKTEEALGLVNGFLKTIGKDSLAGYYTSALYGEHKAFIMRDLMEKGEDMEKITAEKLNDTNKGLWMSFQLSPYTPYASTIFLRKDLDQMEDWKIMFEKAYDELQKNGRIEFHKLCPDKIEKLLKIVAETRGGVGEFNGFLMDIWRSLHNLVYAKHSDIYRPEKVEFDTIFNQEFSDYIGDNRNAFSLMKLKDKTLSSGSAGNGWTVPASDKCKLSDITDFAMVTGKEFHQDGVFKFMEVEH